MCGCYDEFTAQSLEMIANRIYDVIFHDDDEEHDEHSSLSVVVLLCAAGRGAHMRTVASSDADANIDG